jgi:hypothetical protein
MFSKSLDEALVRDVFQGKFREVFWRLFGLEESDDGRVLPPPITPESLKELSSAAGTVVGTMFLKYKLLDVLLYVMGYASSSHLGLRPGTGLQNAQPRLKEVSPFVIIWLRRLSNVVIVFI